MAQDLRKLFENEQKMSNETMPSGHEKRFIEKLDRALPVAKQRGYNLFLRIAASVVILIGLSLGAYKLLNLNSDEGPADVVSVKSLEEVSPDLKKVEDYYLANINLELSRMEYTPENKEVFDGYLRRLGELSSEYEKLSEELVNNGPNEKTITALIDNLKFRLDLMFRLKEKLNELNNNTDLAPNQG